MLSDRSTGKVVVRMHGTGLVSSSWHLLHAMRATGPASGRMSLPFVKHDNLMVGAPPAVQPMLPALQLADQALTEHVPCWHSQLHVHQTSSAPECICHVTT